MWKKEGKFFKLLEIYQEITNKWELPCNTWKRMFVILKPYFWTKRSSNLALKHTTFWRNSKFSISYMTACMLLFQFSTSKMLIREHLLDFQTYDYHIFDWDHHKQILQSYFIVCTIYSTFPIKVTFYSFNNRVLWFYLQFVNQKIMKLFPHNCPVIT
jgi:hypothetical protein